jgi:hypothetical protein
MPNTLFEKKRKIPDERRENKTKCVGASNKEFEILKNAIPLWEKNAIIDQTMSEKLEKTVQIVKI